MKELLEALKALERLGASWKARRVSKGSLFNTIECTALVQTTEGVVRGLVEIQGKGSDDRRVKAEVSCHLEGKLMKDGGFKHLKHLKDKTVKIFEYENFVMYNYSKGFLGIGQGFRPAGTVPVEHRFLVDFAERLVAVADQQEQAEKSARANDESARKSANEARARHALFG